MPILRAIFIWLRLHFSTHPPPPEVSAASESAFRWPDLVDYEQAKKIASLKAALLAD